jgi:hypothetical protein
MSDFNACTYDYSSKTPATCINRRIIGRVEDCSHNASEICRFLSVLMNIVDLRFYWEVSICMEAWKEHVVIATG